MREQVLQKFNIKLQLKSDKLYFFIKVMFCIIFATTMMLDSMISFQGEIYGNLSEINFKQLKLTNILILIATFILSYIIVSVIEFISDKIHIYRAKDKNTKNIKIFFITLIIILICWLPYILSYFPGGIYSDTATSIHQAMGRMSIDNNHPILYALILRMFLIIGILIKDEFLGIKIFSIVQTIIMASVISYFIYWLYKKNISKKYLIITIIFFSFFKLIPSYAISIWKDTPFSIALFLYIIYLAEIVYNDGKNLENVSSILKYIILSILVILLRNNGIYIVFLTTAILIVIYRKRIFKEMKSFSISAISTILLCIILQGPVYNYFGLNNEFVGNLGILMQQVYYVVADEGDITEEQKEFINNICPIEVIKEEYNPCIVDTINWNKHFNNEFLEENRGKFLKLWFDLFLKNPDLYIKAYLLNTLGFWDITKATHDAYINTTMWPDMLEWLEYTESQSDIIENITNKSIRNILEPKVYISSAVFLFIMLIGIMITIYKKRYKNLLIYIPSLITWLTVMIAAPLAFSLRYVYILVLIIPLSILIPFLRRRDEEQ